jgi:DUF4097 and DUF4098 domain-containing protein YvlB
MRVLLGFGLLLVSLSASAGYECRYSEERKLDIDAAGLRTLALKLGSSDARVQGVPASNRIEVRGKACASAPDRLAGLTIDQHRDGDTVTVTTHQAETQTFSWFGSNYAYLDLEVRLPATLALRIEATSGDAEVADVASLDFVSHSGDLSLHHVAGTVAAEVHSGDIQADDVGSFELRRSGSGDVRVRKVRGEVKVGHVGSGDLEFSDVGGGVEIGSVGSGDVTVDHAAGSVRIDAIGSGDVSASGIGGDLVVQSAGSGRIRHHGVKGRVEVPKDHDD